MFRSVPVLKMSVKKKKDNLNTANRQKNAYNLFILFVGVFSFRENN